jgi:hypothetical protein
MSFIFDIFGAVTQYKASKKEEQAYKISAERAQMAAEAEARQLETRARQGLAVGTYNSERIAKRAKEIMSSQRAAAAAGGGDTTDATVLAITDETIREASMESLLTMAEAEDSARQDRYAAAVTRTTGAQQARSFQAMGKAASYGATASLLSSIGSAVGSSSWKATFGG